MAGEGSHRVDWRDIAWILLALTLLIASGYGLRDPWPADEPRFASLARDMVLGGDWLFPRVGGDLYQDKPPFFFWLLALSYSVFGSVRASFLLPSLLAAELQKSWAAGDRVLLMAHSLGSVIAWDTLWSLGDSVQRRDVNAGIDLFLTLGSPLGTRFVRRRLLGARAGGARCYPQGIHRWRNLAALGDLTALGHRFADDYVEMLQLGLVEEITDQTDLVNPFRGQEGLNVHKCYGYFVNAATGSAIADWWRADGPA